MNAKIILLCVSYCIVTVIARSMVNQDSFDIGAEWEKYKENFNKEYDSDEEPRRKEIFEHAVKEIHLHNERFERGEVSYTKGINRFTDMADEEILENYYHSYDSPISNDDVTMDDFDLDEIEYPANFNWKDEGAVSNVKNNKGCTHSDWAFAALGALEGYLFKNSANKRLTELSEQELIDCSEKYGNHGCLGGAVTKAMTFIHKCGISTESSYPYVGAKNDCKMEKQNHPDGISKGDSQNMEFQKITTNGNDERLQSFLYLKSPVTVGIKNSTNFFKYEQGIFNDESCNNDNDSNLINLLLIGYGETVSKEKYWIVKNWVGPEWGENGYIRIQRGKNICGIANNAWFVHKKN